MPRSLKKNFALCLIAILFSWNSHWQIHCGYKFSEDGTMEFCDADSLLRYLKEKNLAAISLQSAQICGIHDKGKGVKVKLDLYDLAKLVERQFTFGSVIIPPKGALVVTLEYILLPCGWYKLANDRVYEFGKNVFYGPNPYRLYLLLRDINIDLPIYNEENIPDQKQRIISHKKGAFREALF